MADEVASTPGLSSGIDQAPSSPSKSQEIGQRELSLGGALIYSSGNFGAGIFYAFNNFLLPLYLQGLRAPLVLIGLLSSTRSVEGSVIQPLVGAWSDHTWSRLLRGRRRPFIVVCVPLSALLLVLTAFVPAMRGLARPLGLDPNAFSLILATIGIFIFSLTFNIMIDPYTALLADITPVHQRGNVNGLFQMVQAAGQMIVLLLSAAVLFAVFGLDQAFFILFLLTAVALVIFFVPTVLGVREPRALVHAAGRHRYSWRDYVNGLRGQRQVQLYFLVQFFLWFGISGIAPFLTIFATKLIGMSTSEATYLPFVLLGSTAVFNWPLGILADRLGLKRTFLVGMMLMAGASVAGIWVRQKLLIYAVLLVAGIGNSAQTASSYPLLTRLVRPDRMGLYTGLNSTITSIATPASAALTGLLLQKVGPIGMFPFVAACFLATLPPLALLNVKAGEARVQAELRDAEAQ
jgi:maltose/moltooligosaccharide transporter